MTDEPSVDFFISYNKADRAWAEWIAWELEAAGYTTLIQAWDFRPGSNWPLEMHRGLEQADRLVAVLSPDYLAADYTHPEWARAFAEDPGGNDRKLIPVRVGECEPTGLLAQIVYIDLVNREEEAARDELLRGLEERGKPAVSPPFPGTASSNKPAFPGRSLPVTLREAPRPGKLPERPYPLLDAYDDSRLFGGRDAEIESLLGLVNQDKLITCVYAVSGAGKSSLLRAGLVPRLRDGNVPVALVPHPDEPGLAQLVVGSLVKLPEDTPIDDDQHFGFATWLGRVRELADTPPVIVLDQFEDALREDDKGRRPALARLGPLIAATARELPQGGLQCRWVLAYRQEYHGTVSAWLEDVLEDARGLGRDDLEGLPHNLGRVDRVHSKPIPVFGCSGSGANPRDCFLQAITKPLALAGGDGGPFYRLHFSDDGAERLAEAFAAARTARPKAPLLPEFQVVIGHRLEQSEKRSDGSRRIVVPGDVGERIEEALEEHLLRVLERVYPAGPEAPGQRTRLLLVLRELAEAEGRRASGLRQERLESALGPGEQAVLDKLSAADSRLIVKEERPDGSHRVRLSHDRLAAVLVRLFQDEAFRRQYGLDERAIELRALVSLKTDLYQRKDPTALDLAPVQHRLIEEFESSLLMDDKARQWWQACRERRKQRRRTMWRRAGAAGLLAVLLGFVAWKVLETDRQRRARAFFLTQLESSDHQHAFRGLLGLASDEEVADKVQEIFGTKPDLWLAELFVEGPWEVGANPSVPADEILEGIESLVEQDVINSLLESRAVFGALMYVVEDVGLRHSNELGVRAQGLRGRILNRFNHVHPEIKSDHDLGAEDSLPNPRVPFGGGPFTMGEDEDEHPVTLSEFEIQAYEVSNREYRRFYPKHEGEDDYPAVDVNWYEAMGYAAWLEGSLPTEAQWEYVARGPGGRPFAWGPDPPTDEQVAALWEIGPRSPDRFGATPNGERGRVYGLAALPWEWCRDWWGKYEPKPPPNPLGPPTGRARVLRGGAFDYDPQELRASFRLDDGPEFDYVNVGFRVAWSPPAGR